MINVLLISYYWPPAGGGGVHRWLKMSKYFPYDKMNLFVFTPDDPEYPAYDESLVNQINKNITIIKRPITEPYSFYKKFTGKKKDEKIYSGFINDKKSWKNDLAIWIRSNFFIPDARFLWIKPSIKFLKNKINELDIDVVISTGPPHSMHLIANGLKNKNQSLKWIADFRDPWTNIDFYNQLKLSAWADKKHHRLEKRVLQNADKIVTVSWSWQKEFEEISKKDNIEVITNGYDHIDFLDKPSDIKLFNLVHLGSLNKDRNPELLWNAISELDTENALPKDFSVDLIGNIDQAVIQSCKKLNVDKYLKFIGFVSHSEAITKMKESHVLLLLINNTPNSGGIIPGKAFEYLGSKRPIICIGPENCDIKKLLSQYSHVHYIEYGNVDLCKKVILELNKSIDNSSEDVYKYSREKLANDYFQLIEKIAS